MKKMAFIYNPLAGKGKIENHLLDIIKVFTREEETVTLVPTRGKNYCRDFIVNEGCNFDEIVVSGGDGTVNEAFNAYMALGDKKPNLGYIPMGTTNDFALSCSIPTDPFEAAKAAVYGNDIRIDCGRFDDMYFAYVAAFGIFTDVAYDTPQEKKNLLGRAAYIVEGIKRLGNVKSYKMKIQYDSGVIEDEFIYGMVANSNSVGGLNIKKMKVDLSDGLFEVLLFKKIQKVSDFNAIITDLLNNNKESEYYYIFKTSRLSVYCDENVAWTLDGEYGGEKQQLEIENIKQAIRIRVKE